MHLSNTLGMPGGNLSTRVGPQHTADLTHLHLSIMCLWAWRPARTSATRSARPAETSARGWGSRRCCWRWWPPAAGRSADSSAPAGLRRNLPGRLTILPCTTHMHQSSTLNLTSSNPLHTPDGASVSAGGHASRQGKLFFCGDVAAVQSGMGLHGSVPCTPPESPGTALQPRGTSWCTCCHPAQTPARMQRHEAPALAVLPASCAPC